MSNGCPHRSRRVDGIWPAREKNKMPDIAFTCYLCRTSALAPWEDFSGQEQDEALIKGVPGDYMAAVAM